MIFLAALVILLVFFTIWGFNELRGFSGAFLGWCLGMLICIMLSITYLAFDVALFEDEIITKVETRDLIALKDNAGQEEVVASGIFVSRIQTSDGMFYDYLYETDKGIEYDSAPGINSYLNEIDSNFYVEVRTFEYKGCGDLGLWFFDFCAAEPPDPEYYFYIPEESITEEIILDLE